MWQIPAGLAALFGTVILYEHKTTDGHKFTYHFDSNDKLKITRIDGKTPIQEDRYKGAWEVLISTMLEKNPNDERWIKEYERYTTIIERDEDDREEDIIQMSSKVIENPRPKLPQVDFPWMELEAKDNAGTLEKTHYYLTFNQDSESKLDQKVTFAELLELYNQKNRPPVESISYIGFFGKTSLTEKESKALLFKVREKLNLPLPH